MQKLVGSHEDLLVRNNPRPTRASPARAMSTLKNLLIVLKNLSQHERQHIVFYYLCAKRGRGGGPASALSGWRMGRALFSSESHKLYCNQRVVK